jgi:hypothetical protein
VSTRWMIVMYLLFTTFETLCDQKIKVDKRYELNRIFFPNTIQGLLHIQKIKIKI